MKEERPRVYFHKKGPLKLVCGLCGTVFRAYIRYAYCSPQCLYKAKAGIKENSDIAKGKNQKYKVIN